MITREQLNEIQRNIMDLQMALDFNERAQKDEPFVILPGQDPITITFSTERKAEFKKKVDDLSTELETRMVELKKR